MKLFKKLLIGVLCCAVPALLFSQDFSNKGKEFWIPYSYHVGMSQGPGSYPTMTLYITSDLNTNYTVEIYGVTTLQTGSITAGQVVSVVVPTSYILNSGGLFIRKNNSGADRKEFSSVCLYNPKCCKRRHGLFTYTGSWKRVLLDEFYPGV